MKKICSIVGARPQFIKLALVSKEIRKKFKEIIIHTGQHFDYNMSDIFFSSMDIPKPDYNLGITARTHGEMTGKMIIDIEKILIAEKPDMVLLFGDTNSTLSGAIAASKLNIPIAHVEAGNRFNDLNSPEEINRILTDHVSSINFACTESAFNNLKKENLSDRSYLVGDPMFDAFKKYSKDNSKNKYEYFEGVDGYKILIPNKFYYMTCHRQENTDDPAKLLEILSAMNSLDFPTLYPVHPRNRKVAIDIKKKNNLENIYLLKPLSYFQSLFCINNSIKILTDSGGLQREAFFANKDCVTVLNFVCWPETMVNDCNRLSKPEKTEIFKKISTNAKFDRNYLPFGDGESANKICHIIEKYLKM